MLLLRLENSPKQPHATLFKGVGPIGKIADISWYVSGGVTTHTSQNWAHNNVIFDGPSTNDIRVDGELLILKTHSDYLEAMHCRLRISFPF